MRCHRRDQAAAAAGAGAAGQGELRRRRMGPPGSLSSARQAGSVDWLLVELWEPYADRMPLNAFSPSRVVWGLSLPWVLLSVPRWL